LLYLIGQIKALLLLVSLGYASLLFHEVAYLVLPPV